MTAVRLLGAALNIGYYFAMIRRLYAHNFKCLENFELPICGRSSSLLIGRNGTGKSTVGTVLELFQSIARGTNRVGQLVRPSDFAQGRSDVPMRFEIEVSIDNAVYGYTLAFELPPGLRELRVLEEKLTVGGKPIYSREEAQVQLTGNKRDKDAKFSVDWHLVALPVIQAQSTTDPLYVFQTWLARMLILAPLPSQITGDSEAETLTPNRQVTNFGEWFSGLLANSPAAYTQIDNYLKEVMPDFREIKNPFSGKDSRSLTVRFQQDKAVVNLPFCDLSDGEKCFFICAVVLAANEAYGPLFCFWDEPDNYLSLSEVGHFVIALRRSFQDGGQLLVTSHNPEAVRRFSDENTLVVGRRSHLEPTIIRPLSEMQIHGDLMEALIRDEVEL